MSDTGLTKDLASLQQKELIKKDEGGRYIVTEGGQNLLSERELEQGARDLIEKLGIDKAKKFIKLASIEATRKEVRKGDKWRGREFQQLLDELERWEKVWNTKPVTADLVKERNRISKEAQEDSAKSGPPRFVCPKCGELLSLIASQGDIVTGELSIQCTCEFCDYGGFYVHLPIRYRDLKHFTDKVAGFDAKLEAFYDA